MKSLEEKIKPSKKNSEAKNNFTYHTTDLLKVHQPESQNELTYDNILLTYLQKNIYHHNQN